MSQISSDVGSPYEHDMPRIFGTQKHVNDGYVFYETDISIEDLDLFVAKLKDDPKVTVVDLRQYNQRLMIKTEEFVLTTSHNSSRISIQVKTHNGLLAFLEKYKNYIVKHDDESISIYYFYMSKGEETQNRFMSLKFRELPTVIPELYPDIDIKSLSRAFQESDSPILLLYGVPGVGKTTYLKYMLSTRAYERIAYVKDIRVMQSSDFWSTLATNKYDLIIFDDLDFALGPREEGNHSSFVSNLLSYSDGIFNHSRSKIVITTNQTLDRVDSALVRPGRCFDFLVLNPLTHEQAYDIWTNILSASADDFGRLYDRVDEITQAGLMSNYQRLQDASMERSYIKGEDRFYTVEEKLNKYGIAADGNRHLGFMQ